MMTKQIAIKYLESYNSKTKIYKIYDDGSVSQAILILIPKFEYPDWSHKTVGDILKVIKE